MQAATMPLPDPSQSPSPRAGAGPQSDVLKVFLLIVAGVQTAITLPGLMFLLVALFIDKSAEFVGWKVVAVSSLSPFVAVAALAYAAKDRKRHAIVALGVLGLLDCLNYLPSLAKLGSEASIGTTASMLLRFGLPSLCIAGIVLAIANRFLGRAAALASATFICMALAIAVMSVSIAFYGF